MLTGDKIATINFFDRLTTNRPVSSGFVLYVLINDFQNFFTLSQLTIRNRFIIGYCKQVVCVEKDARAVAFIQAFASELQAENIQVIRSEVLQFLRSSFLRFDFIFADPPYDFANYAEMIAEIEHRKMLKPNGMLVIEHGQEADLQHFAGFEVMRVYGRVHFSFFRFEENP